MEKVLSDRSHPSPEDPVTAETHASANRDVVVHSLTDFASLTAQESVAVEAAA
ncbi:hypothetical protein GCM10022263_10890 [Nocardioides daeguensis]|uniref:Uncharacterized protein n=1 Tax=Nocardioides daeguensis TaxID=908359 RepID=A0ABP6UWU8_9ACTN